MWNIQVVEKNPNVVNDLCKYYDLIITMTGLMNINIFKSY